MDTARDDLLSLKNIGPRLVDKLAAIGISSRDQIAELGAAQVYLRLQERFPVSMTMLWALQGALLDLPYYEIPAEIRAALLDELSGSQKNQAVGF